MKANKKLCPIVTELFLRERELKILVFILQSYLKVPKLRLNATHFIMKIPNKKELKQIAPNHLSDIELKDVIKLYKTYTKENIFIVSEHWNINIR